jgi:transposase-like protein
MATADYQGPLGGHVEIDETRIGGKQTRPDERRKGTNKTIVMGIVERDGRIKAGPLTDATQYEVEPIVLHHVERGSIVSTDESRLYSNIHKAPYNHGVVQHGTEEYVRGIHHTNTIEGHWSQLKRSIRGTHVHVSSKHLWKYVSEFSYRRNFRQSHQGMFNRLVASFSLPRLTET